MNNQFDLLHEDCLPEYNGIPHWQNTSLIDIPGEIWLPIKEWEKHYMVSNFGRIKSIEKKYIFHINDKSAIKKERIRKQSLCKGYCQVGLSKGYYKKTCYVHILTGLMFIDNPNSLPEINHKKGIKT
ncbi:MAG: NUMOD4 domain-containing protein, partial [Nanoarchaeota archaeon]